MAGPGGGDELHRVAHEIIGDRHLASEFLESERFGGGEDGFDLSGGLGSGARNNFDFFGFGKVVDAHVEEKPIELGFGERVGAFHLDGVLSGEHEERFAEGMTDSAGSDLVLLHGFEQGGLGLGRRAIDFVGE